MSEAINRSITKPPAPPDPAIYWTAVDRELELLGHAPALWLEEVRSPYTARLSIYGAVSAVLAGRRVPA
jgi:hypothetical protein